MAPVGFRDRLAGWLSHDAHPVIQFMKYAVTGGLATVVHYVSQILAVAFLFPIRPEDKGTFSIPYMKANALAFILSVSVVYPLNRMFVFRPGRHNRVLEISLFFGFAILGVVSGTMLGAFLVQTYGIPNHFAMISTVVTSAMVNYAGRKFCVFKG